MWLKPKFIVDVLTPDLSLGLEKFEKNMDLVQKVKFPTEEVVKFKLIYRGLKRVFLHQNLILHITDILITGSNLNSPFLFLPIFN